METVVVERRLEAPLDLELLRRNRDRLAACLEAYGVSLLQSFVAPDGKRMICVYRAPDAESVRRALRQNGVLPFDTVWKARVVRPDELEAL